MVGFGYMVKKPDMALFHETCDQEGITLQNQNGTCDKGYTEDLFFKTTIIPFRNNYFLAYDLH